MYDELQRLVIKLTLALVAAVFLIVWLLVR